MYWTANPRKRLCSSLQSYFPATPGKNIISDIIFSVCLLKTDLLITDGYTKFVLYTKVIDRYEKSGPGIGPASQDRVSEFPACWPVENQKAAPNKFK